MLEIKVCVGSSCHMKGSYQVVMAFKEYIEKYELEDKINLKASFCMGRCMNGIAVTMNDEPVENVTFTNAKKIFDELILPKAREES